MGGLFNTEGKVFQFLNKAADWVIVSFLWTIFSIPIITIGASTTALYCTMHKVIKLDSGHIFSTFWNSFKNNFVQATCLWGILLLIFAFLSADLYLSYILSDANNFLHWTTILIIVVFAIVVMWSLHWFAYISHISDPVKTVLKNTLIMCIANIPYALSLFLIFGVCVGIIIFMPISPVYLLILPSGYMYFAHKIHIKIFSQYFEIKGLEVLR